MEADLALRAESNRWLLRLGTGGAGKLPSVCGAMIALLLNGPLTIFQMEMECLFSLILNGSCQRRASALSVTELMEFYKDLMVAFGFLPRRKGPVTIPVVRARIEKKNHKKKITRFQLSPVHCLQLPAKKNAQF